MKCHICNSCRHYCYRNTCKKLDALSQWIDTAYSGSVTWISMFFDSPLNVPYLSTIGHTVENVSKDVLGAMSCKQLPLGTGTLYCTVVSPQFTRHTTWGCIHTMHNAKHLNTGTVRGNKSGTIRYANWCMQCRKLQVVSLEGHGGHVEHAAVR